MKTVTTNHPNIGYRNNVEVVETALCTYFGFADDSYMLTAVAAHVWSQICGKGMGDLKTWGQTEVEHALLCCRVRLRAMERCADVVSAETRVADLLVRRHTAFASFEELLTAPGHYRPTITEHGKLPLDAAECRALADLYDAAQMERGDWRRAYRGCSLHAVAA
ncbi:MAG TPA: hypothetical protein VGD81_03250 [Opitutaceae bacterium]